MAEDDWRTITVNVEEDAISLVFDKGHCHSSIGGAGARLTVSWQEVTTLWALSRTEQANR
jgi:hypothetical protein